MMNENTKGVSFTAMMAMLKIPGVIKPRINTLGFSGVEVRSFFKTSHPDKLVCNNRGKNLC